MKLLDNRRKAEKGCNMGILQEWKEIEKLNNEIKQMLGIKTIDITYIESEQAITVRKVSDEQN